MNNNNMFDLTGKVAIITGGNSGIGLGIARGLAGAGATVAITARTTSRSEEVVAALEADGGKALAVTCDVSDEESVKAMAQTVLDQCGRIDILVNNAGTNIRKMPQELDPSEWSFIMNTNLDSAFRCSTACYPSMKAVGGGKILNCGSMLSIFGAGWGAPYSASKAGMVQLTKSLAIAWAADNIQVNCFLPGWIDTPLTQGARRDVPGLNEKVLDRTPAGRWGHIDDFQGLAVFLSAPASDFITGTAIPVDGGYCTNLL
ncbi:MAG: glucose 1-dehydrogenase [Chloroflexota bacterium]